jgi:hypothetical protein
MNPVHIIPGQFMVPVFLAAPVSISAFGRPILRIDFGIAKEKVIWVNAAWVVAVMAHPLSGRDLADEGSIGDSMRSP